MAISTPTPTRPTVIGVVGDGPFDLLDPFGRIFWVNLTPEQALASLRDFGAEYSLIPASGMPAGTKMRDIRLALIEQALESARAYDELATLSDEHSAGFDYDRLARNARRRATYLERQIADRPFTPKAGV